VGLDKSAVSRINKGLDERVQSLLTRSLEGAEYPYVWLDATFPKVREDSRVQSTALVVAMGVRRDGVREILGISLGAAETEAFWTEFLRSLVARGLKGIQLVISDAHEGLKNAIQQVLGEVAWQRCQVHFMRNILSHVPRSAQPEVTNLVRTVFQQPSYELAEAQLKRIVIELETRFPKAADILDLASADLLAHMHFPPSHWRRIRSTNPLERLNREIRRRTDVVGIFPNRAATIRLVGAMLLEQHEEWMTGKRYFSEQSMSELYELTAKSNLQKSQ
jgi:putative transposase